MLRKAVCQKQLLTSRGISIAVQQQQMNDQIAHQDSNNTQISLREFIQNQHLHSTFPAVFATGKKYAPLARSAGYQTSCLQPNSEELSALLTNITSRDYSRVILDFETMLDKPELHQKLEKLFKENLTPQQSSAVLNELLGYISNSLDDLENKSLTVLAPALKSKLFRGYRVENAILSRLFELLLSKNFSFYIVDLEKYLTLQFKLSRYPQLMEFYSSINRKDFYYEQLKHSSVFWEIKLKLFADLDINSWNYNTDTTAKRFVSISDKNWNNHERLEARMGREAYLQELSNEISNIPMNLNIKSLFLCYLSFRDLNKFRIDIFETWGIPPRGQEDKFQPDLVQLKGSNMYPDFKLIELIITIFSREFKVDESLYYLESFTKIYPELDYVANFKVWRKMFRLNETVVTDRNQRLDNFKKLEQLLLKVGGAELNYNEGIISKKYFHYKKFGLTKEMVNELNGMYLRALNQHDATQFTIYKAHLNRYLKSVLFQSSMQQVDIINRDALIKQYAINAKHQAELERINDKSLKLKSKRAKQFNRLQNQIDEEEEEDAIW